MNRRRDDRRGVGRRSRPAGRRGPHGGSPEPGVPLPKLKTGSPAPAPFTCFAAGASWHALPIPQAARAPRLRWSRIARPRCALPSPCGLEAGSVRSRGHPGPPKRAAGLEEGAGRGERGVGCPCAFAGPSSGTALRVEGRRWCPVAGPSRCRSRRSAARLCRALGPFIVPSFSIAQSDLVSKPF